MAKKISKVLASERDYKVRPFALVDHEHEFYPNTVTDIAARDAIVAPLRFEGAIVYVKSDQTTYQLRGGSANANWVVLVDNMGATSHTTLADIGSYTHVQIDSHIDDATLHFTEASISITESQISDLGAYALASHDHDATYLGITDTAVAADGLSTTGSDVVVSAATAPVAGQVLTALTPTTADWQTPGAAAAGDIIQTGSPVATHIGYFTADKNLSGDAGFTWITASARAVITGSSPELRLQDDDNAAATMLAELSFWDSTAVTARIRMDGTGNLRIENTAGEIRFDTGTSDVVVSGNGDLSVGNDLDIVGYITGYGGTPAEGATLQWLSGQAEFALGAVMNTGTPVDNQVAIWTAANTIEGDALFTWDGADLIVGDFFWDGSADQLLLGAGDLGAPGLEIDGSATATPYVSLSQAGTVRAMFRFSDGSDRVEISSTADDITLRPGNVDTVVVTQASTIFTSTLIDLDNSAAATATTIMARNSAGGMTFNINTTTGNAQLGQISGAGAAEDVWINFARNAGVTLRFDNAIKLATVTGGIDVTGAITVSGTVDGRDVDADGTAQDSHIADSTIHFTEASIDIPLSQGANDVTATFGELNLLDLAGLTAGWVLSADTATTASWKAPTGGIGGSITDNQVAVGATTANDIEGSSALTFDGQVLTVGTNAPHQTHLSTLEVVEVGLQTYLLGATNTGGSHFMRGAYHNGTNWVKDGTEEVSSLSFLGTGNIKLRTAVAGVADDVVSWIDALEVDNATGNVTFTGAALTSASTTTRSGLNVAEGVAPSSPVDGDVWITAAGEFFARLNGSSIDLSATGGSGDVTKVGTPVDNEIGVWTGDGTIEGDSTFTYNKGATTTDQLAITGNAAITSGALLSVVSDVATKAGAVVSFIQEHASGAGSTLYVRQDDSGSAAVEVVSATASRSLALMSLNVSNATGGGGALTVNNAQSGYAIEGVTTNAAGQAANFFSNVASRTDAVVTITNNQATGSGNALDVVDNMTGGYAIEISGANLGIKMTGGLLLTERADHANTPAATFGELWLQNGTTQTLIFTDDAGTDYDLLAGGGTVDTSGSPGANQIARFTDADTITGGTDFTLTGDDVLLSGAASPSISITDTTNTVTLRAISTDTYSEIGTTTAHDFRIMAGFATAVTFDESNQHATFSEKVIFDASTTADPSFNIPEGVAPSAPDDGDVWVTAAGAFNARLNGVTVDLAAAGAGDAWGDPIDANITVDTDSTYEIGTTTNKHLAIHSDTFRSTQYLGVGSSGFTIVSGDTSINTGANLVLYAGGYPIVDHDWALRSATTTTLAYDDSTGQITSFFRFNTPAGIAGAAGFNIAEGVAPSSPLDGDHWLTAAGEYFVRLNGVSVDLAAFGTGTIGGSITDNQVAVGATTADDIEGASTFTWDATTLTVDSDAGTTVRIEAGAASDARILFYQTFNQRGLLVYDTSETAMSLSCVSGDVKLRPANTDILTLNSATGAQLHNGGLRLLERSDHAHTPAATYGELWLKTATPNEMWFTDDASTDWQLAMLTSGGDLTVPGELILEAYSEDADQYTATTGTRDLDTAVATYFYPSADLGTAVITFTFSNPASSGRVTSFSLELLGADGATLTWPTSVDWPGGTEPTWTAGVDIVSFLTRDGGTTWHGFVGTQDSQ